MPRSLRAPSAFLLFLCAGCGSSADPFDYSGEVVELPATLMTALPIAQSIALDWSANAYVARMGGDYTLMDAQGRARNHSYVFFARDGAIHRRLEVVLVGGSPWTRDVIVPTPEPEFSDPSRIVDSDVVIAAAINVAELINQTYPDSIPVPENFSARLVSTRSWPEPNDPEEPPPTNVAWRVDFLVQQVYEPTQVLVWWSTARFYFAPQSATMLGDPVIPETGQEVYPNL